jgi:hypothetical protein
MGNPVSTWLDVSLSHGQVISYSPITSKQMRAHQELRVRTSFLEAFHTTSIRCHCRVRVTVGSGWACMPGVTTRFKAELYIFLALAFNDEQVGEAYTPTHKSTRTQSLTRL